MSRVRTKTTFAAREVVTDLRLTFSIFCQVDSIFTTSLSNFIAAEKAKKLDGDALENVCWRISFYGVENGSADVVLEGIRVTNVRQVHANFRRHNRYLF